MTEMAVARCGGCASPTGSDDRFCEHCGASLGGDVVDARGTDRTATDLGVVAAVTDRGLLHATNEDAYFVAARAEAIIGIVCDGVSSSTAGGVAARVAADAAGEALQVALQVAPVLDPGSAVVDALTVARAAVSAIAWAPMRDAAAPSTTIVAATAAAGVVTVAGVGDSRAYWIDDVEVRQLTRDDSWAEEQVASGQLSPDEARRDRRAHMITAWLGVDAPRLVPTVVSFRPTRRGRLLLCSDGLWNSWPEVAAFTALVREASADRAVDLATALTDRAVAAGGHDNITVAVAEIGPPPTTPSGSVA